MFDKLIGNQYIKEIFERLIKTKRVPHSLLLSGQNGIGKKQFALEIARSFVCQNPVNSEACDDCRNCRRAVKFEFPKPEERDAYKKVIFSEHPDIGMVIPYRTNILVDSIRHLETEANFLPYEADARIFLIDDADKMNDSATNALLKTLEEPAEKTYIFLITSRPTSLLPTILSRCQTIRFAPVATSDIEDYLIETKQYADEDARLLARISRGSIAAARRIDLENYAQQRLKMLDVIRSLSTGRNFSIILKTAEDLSDPKNKNSYEENLKILQMLIHDIWIIRNNDGAEIINFDLSDQLKHFAEKIDNRKFATWLTEIENLLENLRSNLNRKIATNSLFMHMAG